MPFFRGKLFFILSCLLAQLISYSLILYELQRVLLRTDLLVVITVDNVYAICAQSDNAGEPLWSGTVYKKDRIDRSIRYYLSKICIFKILQITCAKPSNIWDILCQTCILTYENIVNMIFRGIKNIFVGPWQANCMNVFKKN